MGSMLIEVWATMDAHELSAINTYTLLGGIQDGATEITRLRDEVARLREENVSLQKQHCNYQLAEIGSKLVEEMKDDE